MRPHSRVLLALAAVLVAALVFDLAIVAIEQHMFYFCGTWFIGAFCNIRYRHVPTEHLWPLLEQADELGARSTTAEIREELMRRFPNGVGGREGHD